MFMQRNLLKMNVARILRGPLQLNNSKYATLYLARYFCENGQVKWSNEKLDETVKKNKVVVFMKGIPSQPMCGFSNAVIQILNMHGVENFDTYNILDDQELRQRIKEFSNWPTIPQVYMGGEFIGGCDIFLQMHQNGELIDELLKVGFKSSLLEKAVEEEKGKDNEN